MELIVHNDWKEKLTKHHIGHLASVQNVVENYLGYAKSVFEYQEYCESAKGGSTFSKNMNEWFGTDKNKASELSSIGSEYEYFMDNAKHLPIAHSSMFTLTKMTNSEVLRAIQSGVLTKDTTTAQLKKFRVKIDDEGGRVEQDKLNKTTDDREAEDIQEQDGIPSEELLVDLELVGLDGDGNETWEPREISISDGDDVVEVSKNEKTIQGLAKEVHDLIIKVGDIDLAEDFLGELKSY